MRLPRDLSGDDLSRLLSRFGYTKTRQTGSHMRLTTQRSGEHHVTVPKHDAMKIGTLSAIVREVAEHFDLTRDELLEQLFT